MNPEQPSPDKLRMDLSNQIAQSRKVKALEAENSRLRAELKKYEWQPIETMPYDKFVLVKFESGSVMQDIRYDSDLFEYIGMFGVTTGKPIEWMEIP